jgi:hypothetical protein
MPLQRAARLDHMLELLRIHPRRLPQPQSVDSHKP